MAGQVKHTKIFGGIVPDATMLSVLARVARAQHRCADCGGRRRHAGTRCRAAGFDGVSRAADRGCRHARPACALRREQRKELDVRLPHGGRDCRVGYRPDHLRQAPSGRRRRSHGRHRRDDRARRLSRRPRSRRSSRSPSRIRTCASTCRSSVSRPSKRCVAPAPRCCRSTPDDADLRSPGDVRVSRRGGHRGRRARAP